MNRSSPDEAREYKRRGDAAQKERRFDVAREAYHKALDLYETLPHIGQINALFCHANIAQLDGQMHKAVSYYHRILHIAGNQLSHFDTVFAQIAISPTEMSLSDVNSLLRSYPPQGMWGGLRSLRELSLAAFESGNKQTAHAYLTHAISVYMRQDNPGRGRDSYPLTLTSLAVTIEEPALARQIHYQLSLILDRHPLHIRSALMWHWGRLEYCLGNHTEGYRLCELALIQGCCAEDQGHALAWYILAYMQYELDAMASRRRQPQDADEMLASSVRVMMAEYPNAEDARLLIQRMISLQASLSWYNITCLAPEDWTDDRTEAALKTLQIRQLIKSESHNELEYYEVVPDLDTLFSPDPSFLMSHYDAIFLLYSDQRTNAAEHRQEVMKKQWDTINAAIVWGFDHAPQRAIDLVHALEPFVKFEFRTGAWKRHLEMAFTLAQGLDDKRRRAYMACYLADNSWSYDRQTLFNEALMLFEQADDELGQTKALQGLISIAVVHRRFDEAQLLYARILPIYQRLGMMSHYQVTQQTAQQIAEYAAEFGAPEIAQVAEKSGQETAHNAEAIAKRKTLEDKLSTARKNGPLGALVDALIALSEDDLRLGHIDVAQTAFEEALLLADEQVLVIERREILRLLTGIAKQKKELERVRSLFKQRLELVETCKTLGQPYKRVVRDDQINMMWEWGYFEYTCGDRSQGCDLRQAALTLAQSQWPHRAHQLRAMEESLAEMKC